MGTPKILKPLQDSHSTYSGGHAGAPHDTRTVSAGLSTPGARPGDFLGLLVVGRFLECFLASLVAGSFATFALGISTKTTKHNREETPKNGKE